MYPPRNTRMTGYVDRRLRYGFHDNGNPREDSFSIFNQKKFFRSRDELPDTIKRAIEFMFAAFTSGHLTPFYQIPDHDVFEFVQNNGIMIGQWTAPMDPRFYQGGAIVRSF